MSSLEYSIYFLSINPPLQRWGREGVMNLTFYEERGEETSSTYLDSQTLFPPWTQKTWPELNSHSIQCLIPHTSALYTRETTLYIMWQREKCHFQSPFLLRKMDAKEILCEDANRSQGSSKSFHEKMKLWRGQCWTPNSWRAGSAAGRAGGLLGIGGHLYKIVLTE